MNVRSVSACVVTCVVSLLLALCVVMFVWHQPVAASAGPAIRYNFEAVNFPGAVYTVAFAINNDGEIVGKYIEPSNPVRERGFIKRAQGFSRFDYPGDQNTSTAPTGINSEGHIVGQHSVPGAGGPFLFDGVRFMDIRVPGATGGTSVNGLNDSDGVVGQATFFDGFAGFLYANNGVTELNFPGGAFPVIAAWSVNNAGTVVGTIDCQGGGCESGFMYKNGEYAKIVMPGANVTSTSLGGINNRGDLAGNWTDNNGASHGFVAINGQFVSLDFPGAHVSNTGLLGINDQGQVVGFYNGPDCVPGMCGFVATPAQWSSPIQVSGAVEPGFNGNFLGGVSAARCGINAVVGFGDSESGNNSSFAGYAASSDGGATFIDRGVLPNPNSFGNELGSAGPESVACGGQQQFYYATTLLENNQIQSCPAEAGICSSISVSSSSDGGQSWGMPVVVDRQNIDNHQLEFPAIASDPTSPRIYVAYLDQNSPPLDFSFPDCQGNIITELRVAVSSTFGATWTSNVVDHVCDISSNPETQGVGFGPPNVQVSPGGKVYVTYEFQGNNGSPNEIRFARSVNQASSFSTPMIVSKDAINNARPQLAVDRTTSSFRGAIYVTWSGMPHGTTTEVLVADSLNQGVSFSFPRSVRATSVGTQVNPVVAVDNDGDVATCYYVTGTNTPTSSSTYFYNCLTSVNHSASWGAYQKLATSAPPGFNALTSDHLLLNDGFFTAFELPGSTTRKLVGSTSDNP